MKIIYLTIIGLLISGMSFSQLVVKKVISEVAIDGLLEESFWDISTQITIGSSNNTANFGVLWDDNYLYVGVDVEDASLCTNKRQGFYDDGIEICIDGNNSEGTSFDNYDRIFVKPIRSYWIQEMEQRYTGVTHRWIEASNGYSMEIAIPWANFNTTPSAGMDIGFNIAVNDDDNCDNQYNTLTQLQWAGNSNYYKDPSIWGTISLSSETVTYSANYIALLSPNGGDFCINNKITEINWVSNGITNVDIDYSTDNGSTWNSATTNLSASSGSYNWNVSATPSDNCLIRISETGNLSLKDISESVFTISAPLTAVEPLIPNVWKNYEWPYNAYFPEDQNGINGHVGSACGHASLARILHYWEFPIVGNDELTFTDNGGHIWSANFGATTYNYDNMPNYLSPSSTESEYTDVATLTYHAATSMHDIGGSGGNLANMSYAMSHYFNYKVSTPTIRSGYTKAEWMSILINELDNGRVLLIQGMTTEFYGDWHENNGIAGHWFHVDGYNEDGHFHGVLGFSDEDTWFDIDNLFGYYLNNGILIGLEPNLNGKELSLQTHNGGESLQAGQVSQINWSSTGVSNIRIEYTVDNGENWSEIISSTSAVTGNYDWTVPNISSDECKIKLTDVDNINVYDKSNDVFSSSLYELELTAPNGGEYFVAGDLNQITWANTPVVNIKIEFSDNNGSNWNELTASYLASSGSIAWTVPDVTSKQCLVKITDVTDAEIFDISENAFEIGQANNKGGPYVSDANTVLLLHFNGNLTNQSPLSDDGIQQGNGISYSSVTQTNLEQCSNFDGSSYVAVPHNTNLNLSGDWTIESWIKITEYNSNIQSVIVSKPGDTDDYFANYTLELHPWWGNILNGLYFSDEQTRINVTEMSLTLNKWYHVAFIRDVSNSKISITVHDEEWNEVSYNSQSYSDNDVLLNSKNLIIGENFDGYMDELRISNVVRTWEDELQANFSANTVLGPAPLEVNFTDLSTQGSSAISKWNWDFDNNGTIDSYDRNPTWTYSDIGTYTVSLTVGDGTNLDTLTKTDYINVTDVDPETRILLCSNSRFEVWGFITEDAAADSIIKVLTANYDRLADSLNVQLTEKVVVDVYPDLSSYHTSIGWPDAPDWVVGTAGGVNKIDLVSPYNPGPVHTFESIMDVITHELVHCFVHKLSNGANISTWINEGSAGYLSYQVNNLNHVCYYINQNSGIIPTLNELNNGSTFGDIGGYSFSYTIVEFIVTQLGGSNILSQFIASGLDYSILGCENELEFQNEWNQYIYLNFECTYSNLHAAFLANIVSGTSPLEVEFNDYSEQGTTAITEWSWDFESDGTIDSYDQNPIWTYNEIGTYSVSLTVGDGTNSNTYTKTDYIDITDYGVYIDDSFIEKESISIYPNPAHSKVYISTSGTFTLSISTITGQKILDKDGFESESLDISSYDKGIYIVTIKDVNGSITKKLIIQ